MGNGYREMNRVKKKVKNNKKVIIPLQSDMSLLGITENFLSWHF